MGCKRSRGELVRVIKPTPACLLTERVFPPKYRCRWVNPKQGAILIQFRPLTEPEVEGHWSLLNHLDKW